MNLSKTSKYALRILGFMAITDQELFSAKFIYENRKIPQRYLRRLLTDLTKSGIINSTQGRNGGYALARRIDQIYLADIIDAVDGFESINSCLLGYDDCAFNNDCAMHNLWADTQQKIRTVLTTTSLADLKKANKSNIIST